MLAGIESPRGHVVVGEGPADVVVAAHVVHPAAAFGYGVAMAHGVMEHARVAGGQGLPQQGHELRVVGERALPHADVLVHLVGMHDGL